MRIFLFLLLVILSIFTISAQNVEQFSSYDTTYTFLEKNLIEVNKKIYLRNIHSVGIVPGQVEFKLSSVENSQFEIFDVSAKNRYGQDINSQLRTTANYYTIFLNIFTPVLPGFEYEINLNYKIKFDNSGIFFKRVQLPLVEDSRIPILSGNIEVNFPKGNSITYLDFKDEFTTINKNQVNFKLSENTPNQVLVEYSKIPFGIGSIPGSLVFWLLINFLLIIILALEIRKELKQR